MRREYVENDRVLPLQFYIETQRTDRRRESNPLVEFATANRVRGLAVPGRQTDTSRAVGVDMNRSKLVNGRNSLVEAGTLPAPEMRF